MQGVGKKNDPPPPGKQSPPSARTRTRSAFIPPASLTDLSLHHLGARRRATIGDQTAYITTPQSQK